jgi:hypothetical protein
VVSVLFGQAVAYWWRQMTVPTLGARLLAEGISHTQDHYVVCLNPFHGESFSGRHGRHTLFVFDESSAIPDERFNLADTQATKFVALSNPRTLSGRFRLAFVPCRDQNRSETILGTYGYRRCITVDGADVLNVRRRRLEHPVGPLHGLEIRGRFFVQGEPIPGDYYDAVRPLVPGQLCYDTYLAHCQNPDRRWADVFAHGRFPDEDPQVQVILHSWLHRHVQYRQTTTPRVTCFGLDLADSEHGDETILAAAGAEGCAAIHERRQAGAMETCGWVLSAVEAHYGIDLRRGEMPIVVDAGGLGSAVCSRLRELGVRVVEFRGNDRPSDPKRFVNRRAEAYGVLADRLNPSGAWAGSPWGLPDDSLLHQDLCAPEKIYDSDGFRYRITPKRRESGMPENRPTLQEKLGRSPDRGDAVVMLHWGIHSVGSMAQIAISRFKVQSVATLPGAADERNNGCHGIIAAAYEDRRFNTTGLALVGVNKAAWQFDLLRCESWTNQTPAETAEAIIEICRRHWAWGLAVNQAQSVALVSELRLLNPHPEWFYHCELGTPQRARLAQNLVNALETQMLRMYQDHELLGQLAALPIEYRIDGAVLGDPTDATPQLERAMAVTIAVTYAIAVLKDMAR